MVTLLNAPSWCSGKILLSPKKVLGTWPVHCQHTHNAKALWFHSPKKPSQVETETIVLSRQLCFWAEESFPQATWSAILEWGCRAEVRGWRSGHCWWGPYNVGCCKWRGGGGSGGGIGGGILRHGGCGWWHSSKGLASRSHSSGECEVGLSPVHEEGFCGPRSHLHRSVYRQRDR